MRSPWALALPLLLPWVAGGLEKAARFTSRCVYYLLDTLGNVKWSTVQQLLGAVVNQLQTLSNRDTLKGKAGHSLQKSKHVKAIKLEKASVSGELCPKGHGLSALQPGLCRYGTKLACCYGWRRGSKGVCEATCEPGCKFGECVGPNKCRCFPGYTGKTCSQDVNECGEKPRPCQHRCVNTHGSYKCFCLSGHMLMPDATCANSRTCAMTYCQYSCEDTKEGPRCLCPSSGLHLAPNGRLCIDIDECASGEAVCPYNRRCVNTFGSYYCKCHVGFELKYVSGRYDCVDINECAVNTHMCSLYANCFNTQGSFKCKCKQGYKGSGLQCSVIPEKSVKEVLRAPGTIKDRIKKLLAHKNSMKKKVKIKSTIVEPAGTPAPKGNLRPFDSEESVSRDRHPNGGEKGNEERKREGLEEEKRDETALKNHVEQERSLRGDVFYHF